MSHLHWRFTEFTKIIEIKLTILREMHKIKLTILRETVKMKSTILQGGAKVCLGEKYMTNFINGR